MKITINDTQIALQSEDTSTPYTLLTKPEVDDYSNLTTRPLVVSYHIASETVWERFCQCVRALESSCPENPGCECYFMLLGALYTPLLANSQAKNIFHYSLANAAPFLTVLQDFMAFLQEDSSLVSLPHSPAVFPGLAAHFWHTAIIDLDGIDSLQTLCDAMTRVKMNGIVLLYTVADTMADDIQRLLTHATKTAFSACTLYVFTMDSALADLLYPCTTEAAILMKSENLLTQVEELGPLTQKMEEGNNQDEDCLYAINLLCQTEDTLFDLYDYLENPRLPIYAGALKESVMDCYTALSGMSLAPVYVSRLTAASHTFFTAIDTEFQN